MSVLKSRRTESKAEYIYTANKIYAETIRFLSRLSARYSRLMSDSVAKLASEVVDNCEKANSIYPSDDIRKQLREKHLLEARASLMAFCHLLAEDKMGMLDVSRAVNSAFAYLDWFNNHRSVLKLKRLFYALFEARPDNPNMRASGSVGKE